MFKVRTFVLILNLLNKNNATQARTRSVLHWLTGESISEEKTFAKVPRQGIAALLIALNDVVHDLYVEMDRSMPHNVILGRLAGGTIETNYLQGITTRFYPVFIQTNANMGLKTDITNSLKLAIEMARYACEETGTTILNREALASTAA